MKGSGWFLKPPPSSFVPSAFPFLSHLSVCLCVSRVRAYLTTNQHRTRTRQNTINNRDKLMDKLRSILNTIIYFIICLMVAPHNYIA
jgi:hypothetical protein